MQWRTQESKQKQAEASKSKQRQAEASRSKQKQTETSAKGTWRRDRIKTTDPAKTADPTDLAPA